MKRTMTESYMENFPNILTKFYKALNSDEEAEKLLAELNEAGLDEADIVHLAEEVILETLNGQE